MNVSSLVLTTVPSYKEKKSIGFDRWWEPKVSWKNSENKFACNFYYYLNWNPPESAEEMEMEP